MSDQQAPTQQAPQPKKTALERLEQIERVGEAFLNYAKECNNNLKSLNENLTTLSNKLNTLTEDVEAIMHTLVDKGSVTTQELGDKRASLYRARRTAYEDNLIAQGFVSEGEQVEEGSVVVLDQHNKEKALVANRILLEVASLKPELKTPLVGKWINEEFAFEETTIKVIRILNPITQGSKSEAAAPAVPELKVVETDSPEAAASDSASTEAASPTEQTAAAAPSQEVPAAPAAEADSATASS